ncbi:type II toxin-antitoxin system VapC family toxin [Mycolicibacterium brumae]|uniref:Ribonuclease VapC n=1 Tax=Mycolicibacterium brumae TaxID=85968 RepID=A0A2G5PCP9_9MYCO|nr:type II toxin-antitoxin system VapC family toxin [Mycolicibacterium brumae]MCV7193534.1 type II toxin-antitoxin system VapC family toxin [Mycolicibacterium brumae]PIB76111.1 PIN domain-containing protein [Mycolicibacterium brumae]RWA17231.1 hypothetical protein MBRU_06295 [Mycolicibacterium brumae DSM 44177]UWW09193.1 type II toxin-antitoxin system VapC family toxin [Mycolicibacterium brumae]
MIYLDTSALVKLLVTEDETPALRRWLSEQTSGGVFAATSTLGRIELMRAAARYSEPGLADRARFLLDGMDLLPLTESVLTLAETIGPPSLRSLDAIHLAAAAHVRDELTAFVTYDRRLLDGCCDVGLAVVSPGA